MIRIITFIIIFAVFLGFIILNLDNKCNVSFGFTTLEDIPIYLSGLFSFVLGMLVTIPMLLSHGRKKEKPKLPKPSKKGEVTQSVDELKKESSPYGID
jgi:uncharacterized integral membrane protein